MKIPEGSRIVKVDLDYKLESVVKPNIDLNNYQKALYSILSESLEIPMHILDKPFCRDWMIYRIMTNGTFETMTEYNGFLTEV